MALLAGGGAAVGSVGGGYALRSAPTMKKSTPMPIAEIKRDILRPSVSTKKNTKKSVVMSFTMP